MSTLKSFSRIARKAARAARLGLAATTCSVRHNGRVIHHAATSYTDALDWLAQYPEGTVGRITQAGKTLYQRTA